MSLPLDISTPEVEGVYQASKFRKLSLLISGNEMEALMNSLGPVHLFDGSRPLNEGAGEISASEFCTVYRSYVDGIAGGFLIDEAPLRPYFSAMMTKDPSALYAYPIAGGRFLIRPRRPVIQLQRHHFVKGEKFYSGVMAKGSITWGISFSFPHLAIDPKTQEILKIPRDETFDRIAKWVRNCTRPTPILSNGCRINLPLRLGRACFSWIHNHADLIANGLEVDSGSC